MTLLTVGAGVFQSQAGRIGAYGIAAIVQGASSFLMIALLIRVASTDTFARWVLLEPLIATAASLALIGANYGLIKLVGEDRLGANRAFATVFHYARWHVISVAMVAAFATAYLFESGLFAVLVGMTIASEAMFMLLQAAHRAGNRAFSYAAGVLIRNGTLVAAIGVAGIAREANVTIYLIAGVYLIASACGGFVSYCALSFEERPGCAFSFQQYRSAVSYGWPMMIASLFAIVLATADRYVLGFQLGLAEAAQYVAIVKLTGALGLIFAPIALWFPAVRYRHVGDIDGGTEFFGRVLLRCVAVTVSVAGIIFIFGQMAFAHFAPGQRWDSITAAMLLIAAVLSANSSIVNVGLLSAGKTFIIPIILLGVGLANLALLGILVPLFGIQGAAGASATAQGLHIVVLWWFSQRVHKVHWPYWKILSTVAVLTVAIAATASVT